MSLDRLLTPQPTGEGTFTQEIPDGWQQGRAAFGGLVLGNLVRAMTARIDDERALRSLTGELFAPVHPGRVEIQVDRLRFGNAVSTLRASLFQERAMMATAVGVFGSPRMNVEESPLDRVAPPAMPPWREVAVTTIPQGPRFLRHFEIRSTGAGPVSGMAQAAGWARTTTPCTKRDDAWLVAHADVWWPAYLSELTEPRPMATIAFTFQPIGTLAGLSSDDPLFHHGEVLGGRDGYLVEQRQLRGSDGRLVALNQQTFVVIK